jgi:hypothetical protein
MTSLFAQVFLFSHHRKFRYQSSSSIPKKASPIVNLINLVRMIPFLRSPLLIVSFCILGHFVFAGSHAARPVSALRRTLFASVMHLGASLEIGETPSPNGLKVCSCEILSVSSGKNQYDGVAVFAEKSFKGSYAANISAANKILEKERKHLKNYFYDHLKVLQRVQGAQDCRSLFIQLKMENQSLQMYDILDADVRVR